ncbi:DJ-1/PfpI family protein [Mycoplasma sp. 394]
MNLLVFIEDNFNDIELVTPLSIWKKSNMFDKITFYHKFLTQASGQFGFTKIENIDKTIDLDEYDFVFIPGGRGAQALRENKDALDKIQEWINKDKNMAAICDAPNVLAEHQIIKKKDFTGYPSQWSQKFRKGINYHDESIVIDKNIISGKSAFAAEKLAYKVLQVLFGDDVAINTYQQISGNSDTEKILEILNTH